MRIGAAHFPFPAPLRSAALERFQEHDEPEGLALADQNLDLMQAIKYFRDVEDIENGTLEALEARTAADGDPGVLTREQRALLRWLDAAWARFEQSSPLEESLAWELRRLKPLAAAVTLADPRFSTPGEHPLHDILDTLHTAGLGWQQSLGRAGKSIEKMFSETIEESRRWFTDPEYDLSILAQRIGSQVERDLARTQKMTQRVVEVEQGRLRAARARALASECINRTVEGQQATDAIGAFLKGPWFDSLQLVILKHGADSTEWKKAEKTTQVLLDTLQDREQDDARRQYLFDTIPKLPRHLKQWLLSLQHDPSAVRDAVSAVEFAHMRILRQQPLDRVPLAPLPPERDGLPAPIELNGDQLAEIAALEVGQWFRIQVSPESLIRAQLALKLDREQLLLFTNQAGIRAAQYSHVEFLRLADAGGLARLERDCGFSIALAAAAGIETESQLAALSPTDAESVAEPEAVDAGEDILDSMELDVTEAENSDTAAGSDFDDLQDDELDLEAVLEAATAERETTIDTPPVMEVEELSAEDEAALADYVTGADSVDSAEAEGSEAPTPVAEPAVEPAATTPDPEPEITLAMGTWLGFHDGEMPMMARLAVHDRERDAYIFVNREGIKLRELNRAELANLIQQELVDIIETRSNFRDAVTRAQGPE